MKKFNRNILIILFLLSFLIIDKSLAENNNLKKYDMVAKKVPSVNDVYSAIFNWFAMFDHQQNVNLFIDYIDPNNINYDFLGDKIMSIDDFKNWYKNVENNIQYNSHMIKDLKIEKINDYHYKILVLIEWKARLYDKNVIEKNINQNIEIKIIENRIYIVKIEAKEDQK